MKIGEIDKESNRKKRHDRDLVISLIGGVLAGLLVVIGQTITRVIGRENDILLLIVLTFILLVLVLLLSGLITFKK